MKSLQHRLLYALNAAAPTSSSNLYHRCSYNGSRLLSACHENYSTAACPRTTKSDGFVDHGAASMSATNVVDWSNALPYTEIPGPKPIPILGNTWRMMPIVGQYAISDVAKVSANLHKNYGRIVRLGGLIGRPDLLFIFDADEIEKCYRNEGPTPFRPSMPSLVKYKSVVRKDFFGDVGGVVGVHGEAWRTFRSKVQKPILQTSTVRKYLIPLEEVTTDFLKRCECLLDENSELPDDFDNEIHKWALECIGRVALDTRLGCLEPNLASDSEPQQIINAAKYALRNVATLELKAPYWRYFPTPLWTRYVNNMNYFVDVCMKYIQNATNRLKIHGPRTSGEPSLLEKIILTQKNEKVATIMALDLLLVGIDTISMAVCSMLYQLATRPEQQEKVREELQRLIPSPETPLTIALLDQMHFLKAFIREVFRVYSTVIGNGRTLQKDTIICGYQVPKGCYRNEGPTPFRPSMPSLVKYKSVVRKDFFGDVGGVVGVHGEAWRTFRSKVQKPILQTSTVRKYLIPLEEVTTDFLKRCECLLDENSELPDDFDNEIHKWALECIGRVALDTRLGCLEPNLASDSEPQQIINAAKYALRNVATLELKAPYWRYFPTPLWTRYVNNMNYFVDVCMKYIQNATNRLKIHGPRTSGEPSLLEKIILTQKNEKVATIMALDLLLVGIDTISMAVCSMLYQLATRPEQQEKVREELQRLIPSPETPLTIALLDQMHFLKAFIREVFRVYSTVIGNGRTLQKDTIICGYQVPKGVQVVFPTIVTGNMEEYVTNASQFMPERWLRGYSNGKIHPFASLPYGYGARMCLGKRFADLEMQILLAKLIRNYKLEYNHESLDYAVTFMYAPDGPLKFKMTKIQL